VSERGAVTTSPRSRFLFTVGVNLLRSAISFITGMLVARWLGPDRYGSMAFLLGTFAGVRALLDMGSASAFFTFLSQRPRSVRFVRGYLLWLGAQCVVSMLCIALLMPTAWVQSVWHGESRVLVLLAFAATFMQGSVWPVVQQAGESQRRTQLAQAVGVAIVVLHLIAMGLCAWLGLLGLPAIFAALALEYCIGGLFVMQRLQFAPAVAGEESGRQVLARFRGYCLPLVPFAVVSFMNEFVDRWLLQQYGGRVQQAFYAVGSQLASIALIATASILSIFWKEIAEANHRQDHGRTAALYRRVSRLMFFAGAAAAGFAIPWSSDVIRLVLGPAYVGGATTLAIMLLYPIHQSMGQIGATMMYATERVRAHAALGIASMVSGMIMTYVVLAPSTNRVPGLGLASVGLAIKMITVQAVSVNVLAFVIARVNHWRFDWAHQPASIAVCLVLGWLTHGVVNVAMPATNVPAPARLAVAAVVFSLAVCGAVLAAPWLVGFSRGELTADVQRAWRFVSRRGAV
jgi:O-antigen/teichoic acid export membrane protein